MINIILISIIPIIFWIHFKQPLKFRYGFAQFVLFCFEKASEIATCGCFIVVPLIFEFVAIRSLVVGSICYSSIGCHGPWKSRIPRLAHLKQRSWVLLYAAKWWHWGKWPNSLWYFPILFSRAISQKFHATPFTWRLPSVNGASGSSTLKFILLWYPYYFYSNIVLLLLTLFCTNIYSHQLA